MAIKWWGRILRIEPGVSLGQWAYDRIANNWDRFVAAFIAGGGMTYLASITDWMAKWGPLGLGAAGLAAALAVWIGMALASSLRAKARIRQIEASAVEKWKDQVDSVNPLAPEFHTKRLRIADIAHPISQRISNKRLIDCELIGPGNLLLAGGGQMNGVNFTNCDIIIVRDNVPLMNVVVLENVTMLGGTIWNSTILVSQRDIKAFVDMGANFVSLTGLPEIDSRPPPSFPERMLR